MQTVLRHAARAYHGSARNIVRAAGVLLFGLSMSAHAADVSGAITAAVDDPSRPAADRDRDAGRKPAGTLMFAGVKPGMVIAELLPGGGYFTRLLSKVVGDSGHVYAIARPRPADAPADAPDPAAKVNAIAADPAYANVSVLLQPMSHISVPAPVDLVWTSLNYHDLHNLPEVDIAAFNKQVFDALKPGGTFLVVDHASAPGAGAHDTATLHRIDPETVKREVTAAGFVLAATSDLLRRSDDPHTQKVTDAPIRGKTDVFILKFRKPRHSAAAQP
jgi:predicted methyltransferase